MATITTTKAGNLSDTTVWDLGRIPNGTDDTWQVNHNLTIDQNITCGNDPIAGTFMLNSAAGVGLTINTGVTLTLKADWKISSSAAITTGLTMNAGSTLVLDGTGASVNRVIQLGSSAAQRVKIVTNGTAGSRCTFRSQGSSFNGYFTTGGLNGYYDFNYTDFTNIGKAGTTAFPYYLDQSSTILRIDNCVFDGCNEFSTGSASQANIQSVTNSTWKNSVGTRNILIGSWNPSGTTKALTNCAFDKLCEVQSATNGPSSLGVGCVFGGLFNWSGAGENQSCILNGAFVNRPTGGSPTDFNTRGGFQGNYFYISDTATNPHFLVATSNGTTTYIDNVMEYAGSADNGDCFQPSTGTTATCTLVIKNNLLLKSGGGVSSGTLLTSVGNAFWTNIQVEHNTSYQNSSPNGNVVVAETYFGNAGLISSVRSNLFYRDTSAACFSLYESGGTTTNTVAGTVTNFGYNGYYNITGTHFQLKAGGLTNDVANNVTCAANPFVDSTRNLAKWDLSLGGPGTAANAIAEMLKLNTPGYNTAYSVSALLTWVKAGFQVTDATLQNAGHDGVTIGAFAFLPTGVVGATGGRARRSVPVFYHIITRMGVGLSWVKNLFGRRRPWRDRNLAYG